ncbi:MAG: hypothetical protein QG620_531 [Patescibacteria group bacterium]|nr:hypothetical protein [Patescibacteria group bacterium]
MNSFEIKKAERFEGDKYKNCILRKMEEFKVAFKDDDIRKSVDDIIKEIRKLEPQHIMNESHFGHIIGQLNIESAYAVRLEKLKERAKISKSKEDELRARGCEQLVQEVRASILEYIELCLDNKDYFYGEIAEEGGYFGDKNIIIDSDKKIEGLNAKEFVLASKDIFEEKANKEN